MLSKFSGIYKKKKRKPFNFFIRNITVCYNILQARCLFQNTMQHASSVLICTGLCKITLSKSAVVYIVGAILLINQRTGKKTKQNKTRND